MCGRECPPSYTECPDCAAKQKAAAVPAPVPAAAPAAEPPAAAPIPQAARRYQPMDAPPPGPLPLEPRPYPSGVPGWAVTLIVALVLIIVGGGFYYFVSSRRAVDAAAVEPSPATRLEDPAVSSHPYAKHFEITGLRVTEDTRRRAQIRFVLVNHSAAELASVPMQVMLTTSKANPDDPPIATIKIKTPRMAAFESREISSVINTKLRAYELPDWQFLRATFATTATP